MSAQTIIHPSIESLKEDALKTIIDNANKYFLDKKYGLGEGYCDFEQLDACMTYDIIDTNNCKLLTIIQKEIESHGDDGTGNNVCNLNTISTNNKNLYELWLSKGNIGTMEDFLNLILKKL